MEKNQQIQFTAILKQHEGIDASYIEFPFEVLKIFGKKGQVKVKAIFDMTITYRGSLANMGLGCHILIITKSIRKELGKSFGDSIEVCLEQDMEVRNIEIPEDIKILLLKNPDALAFYETLSYSNKKEYMFWIGSAKQIKTRNHRIQQFIELLTLKKKLSDK